MANENLKKYLVMKQQVCNIFEDLELFKQFCVDFGYVYDESHLYNERTPAFNEFVKFSKGREPWDQWRTPKRREPRPEYSRSRY